MFGGIQKIVKTKRVLIYTVFLVHDWSTPSSSFFLLFFEEIVTTTPKFIFMIFFWLRKQGSTLTHTQQSQTFLC